MTREESIKILDPKTCRDALMEFMDGSWNQTQALMLIGEAQKMGLDALHAQQTTTKLDRNKLDGCEWCHDEVFFDNEDMELELQHPLEDEPRMVYPNYCPMCGRPLTEEAWVELERKIGGCNGTTDLLE